MQTLPIHAVLPEIISTLKQHNRLILQAPPGAGKTTVVPLALLDAPWLGEKKIIILEPRRLATRNAASRMASLLGEKVGERVGYQIKAERLSSKKTQVLVVTEGILTRMLQSDPALEEVALIIFDEFHERNLHGDLALALSLQSQTLLREELKIMVMSATLNTQALSTLLDGAPTITSEGRAFAVKHIYLEPTTPLPRPKEIVPLTVKTIRQALKEREGSLLVFLPGVGEIKRVEEALRPHTDPQRELVVALYGDMSKNAQERAIRPADDATRKIVLATNIAESSLTIEGITVVIDSGLQRSSFFDSGSGMNRLQTTFISQESATQRSGRAGRLSEGSCYRLWHRHKALAQHTTPEILSSDLTPMMLELAAWGVDTPDELQWLDLPPENATRHAQQLLEQLGALENRKLTAHGEQMLALGTHPRLAHMILKAARLGHMEEAILLAALLSEKEIFTGSARQSADMRERLQTLLRRHSAPDIDRNALHRVQESARGFRNRVKKSTKRATLSEPTALLLAYAFPDRIAKIRAKNDTRYLLSNGKGARLDQRDPLFGTPFLVIADLDDRARDAQIYKAAPLDEDLLYKYCSEQITTELSTRWNTTTERVEAREHVRLGALLLEERQAEKVDEEAIRNALLAALKEEGLEKLTWSKEALRLRERVTFLNQTKALHPELENEIGQFSDLSSSWLQENLEEWLAPHLNAITTFKALQKVALYPILLSLLTWEQQERLDRLAPSRLKVPSGSQVALDYSDPASPTLAVRLQELFGMVETPRLINNNIPLTLHLLSPAHRPMQVTKDLKSFWDNTYDEVKKELRGKYKKHYWPDDPYQAVATNKTKKHM